MKLKLQRKIVFPILVLMIVPTVLLSVLFLVSMQRFSYENTVEKIDHSFNLITEKTHQVESDFYTKQRLISELTALEHLDIFVYDGDELIYVSREATHLSIEELKKRYGSTQRYEIKKRHYEDVHLSIYVIIDRRAIFWSVLELYKPYLILITLSILIALKVVLVTSDSLSKPVSILLEGYNDIIAGNFKKDIEIKREDELGMLGQAFNEMKAQIAIGSNRFLQMKRFNEDILQSISTGIITTNEHGEIINCNDFAMNMIERVMCLDKQRPKIIRALMMQINETIERMDSINRVASFNEYNTKAVIYLDITTSLMKRSSGEFVGVICSFNDITNRKKIEENVERIDRLASLGQLTAALVHEIRNPLSGIKMGAQILNKRLGPHLESAEQGIFEAMIKETDRLDLLMTDLLNFSKPRIPKAQIVDVFEVIDKALLFSEKKIREKAALIEVKDQMRGVQVLFDKGQLMQIFLNVIANALDAIALNGKLEITVQNSRGATGENILVSFEDNGSGIKKENMNAIFDPFFTTREAGTGLGLSVVHKLVVSNQGNIEIDSIESVGTVVKIYLPMHRSA
ncbi:HAMP domain-containing sensor histidine kinase [Fusibacter ferrireducens]|uniref:histidine kinase n=1 Tax=Fusibacter ferrireducens TaxID=2785058 RepID=A0ABR9ZQ45_9FIRM|nr:HAMP domain-containing sensor histidine kinase [Fusibacter ferrireducens]MBF4692576.1 HAMP domain-containing protein [Fusibacter ferrireducens]